LPTYEYRCESGHLYEKREGFDAPAKQKCQVCGKKAQRLLSAPPIVFKGSGFYKTDSRGTSSATADSAPSTPSTTPAAASEHGHSHDGGGHSHNSSDASDAAPAAAS
jgi:putative FmdB family regulatory protein